MTDAQRFDVVNIGRQCLSNDFMTWRDLFAAAYEKGDTTQLKIIGNKMIFALEGLESMLGHHQFFSFQKWIDNAEKFGKDNNEKEYYRRNAATLLTTWGETPQSLNDYASRTWSGLLERYYAKRWQMFINEVIQSAVDGKPFDQKAFNAKMNDFERNFANGNF